MQSQTYLDTYLRLLSEGGNGKWGSRILSEIGFLSELSRSRGGQFNDLISDSVQLLSEKFQVEGAITKGMVFEAEKILSSLSAESKAYTVTCAAHAHIDMNWMWGYQETVSLTIDTVRTMLTLLREYPEFHFSQSQASVYRIIEQYAPEMLEEIKQRVREGRWEVTASTWVENDKNMPNGESMARHLLYTKKYLSQLLEIPEESMDLDFEPDTFGHNANLPEILRNGGVKYYYHCRGNKEENIFKWRAKSGADVLVYRDPAWYNESINEDSFSMVPEFCERYGIREVLKVYGVGDHGGGPSRRDIEHILEMGTWPLYPTIKLGTIRSFFHKLEQHRTQFPIKEKELNYVFTGCYTSQSRIKKANHLGEDRLYDAEALDSQAVLADVLHIPANNFEEAWRKLLFNQFHDILPGSGTVETREFAMGEFQNLMAVVGTNANKAMNAICMQINTSQYSYDMENGPAMGAGAGYGVSDAFGFGFSQSERGSGKTRVYTVFNTTQYTRCEAVEVTLWDWAGDPTRIQIFDSFGNPVPCQVTESGVVYWGHSYHKLIVWLEIPPMGYASCKISELPPEHAPVKICNEPRCDVITDADLVMENTRIRAVFKRNNMKVISLVRKSDGVELIDPAQAACGFSLLTEDCGNGMTSWRVGNIIKAVQLNDECAVILSGSQLDGPRKWLTYELKYERSRMKVTITLDEDTELLRFAVHVDWQQTGNPQEGVPQLRFSVPCGYQPVRYRYTIPFGLIDREPLKQDVPSNSLACAMSQQGSPALVLLSDCKYGYRGDEEGLSLDLIRGSFDPDPYPESGLHIMNLGVAVSSQEPEVLLELAERFLHPLFACSNTAHQGELPLTGSLLELDGAKLAAVKPLDKETGILIRLYNPTEKISRTQLRFNRKLHSVEPVDFLEKPAGHLLICHDNTAECEINPYETMSLKVVFK